MKFAIRTKNPNYNGITEGVKFENGAAVVVDEMLKNLLVNDYGYDFEVIEGEVVEKPKKTKKK